MKIFSRLLSVPVFLVTTLVFFSCSGQLFTTAEQETGLRALVNRQYSQLEWTDELAPEGLPKPEVKKKVVDSPVFLSVSDGAKAVYPELEGFGSLDNSLLPRSLVQKLDAFFTALPEIADPDFLNPDRPYLPVFLRYTFSPDSFKIKRWIYGKPFFSNSVYEIPVRLYSEGLYMDVYVFVLSGKTVLLDQIQTGEIGHE